MLHEKLNTKSHKLNDCIHINFQKRENSKRQRKDKWLPMLEAGETAVGHKESFEGKGTILHLDCGISQVYTADKIHRIIRAK